VRMLSPRSLPRDRNRIWERGDIQTKKAENNSEDAEAQVVAQGQKKDLGNGYYQQRQQKTTVRMLRPR
jgi:hypothetical protein